MNIFVPTAFSLSGSISFTIFSSLLRTKHAMMYNIINYNTLNVNLYLCWLIAEHITVREWLIELCPCLRWWLQNLTSSYRMKYTIIIYSKYIPSSELLRVSICMNHECISIVCATAVDRDYRVRSHIYYI